MGHYAFLNNKNEVIEVIVGKNEGEDGIDWEVFYGNFRGMTCKRTSYNTHGGIHINGKIPFRKNYASIGYIYMIQYETLLFLQDRLLYLF